MFENAFGKLICEMASILSWLQCLNYIIHSTQWFNMFVSRWIEISKNSFNQLLNSNNSIRNHMLISWRKKSSVWYVSSYQVLFICLCLQNKPSLIARFMGPTWGPSGADRTQVGPMLAPWTLLSGIAILWFSTRPAPVLNCTSLMKFPRNIYFIGT